MTPLVNGNGSLQLKTNKIIFELLELGEKTKVLNFSFIFSNSFYLFIKTVKLISLRTFEILKLPTNTTKTFSIIIVLHMHIIEKAF